MSKTSLLGTSTEDRIKKERMDYVEKGIPYSNWVFVPTIIILIIAVAISLCGYSYKGRFIPLKERRISREYYRDYDYASAKFNKTWEEYLEAREREHPSQEELELRPKYYYNKGYRWKKEHYDDYGKRYYIL